MKTETPKDATERAEDAPAQTEDEEHAKKPRLASIVREVEAAVSELEQPSSKE